MDHRTYLASPFTFFTPSIPYFERRIPPTPLHPLHLILAFIRLQWVLFTLPIHVLLVIFHLFFPQVTLPITIGGRGRKWNTGQLLLYPLITRLIWAGPGAGVGPPDISEEAARSIPVMSTLVQRIGGGEKVNVWIDDVEPAKEGWIVGDAVDPRGEVIPKMVPCFWLELEGDSKINLNRRRAAKEGERICLYLVGGGYIGGNPVKGSRCFDLARETGLRIMGANYRKAAIPSKAFPAGLQDAISAFMHLSQDLGCTDIVLAGDSAGAGLALALLLYLSDLSTSITLLSNFVLPTALLLYSPWVDLTLSTIRNGVPPQYRDDFLNPTQLNTAVEAYLHNTFPRKTDMPHLGLSPDAYKKSPYHLRDRHPLFSPALPNALEAFEKILPAYARAGMKEPRTLIISGTAEYFQKEIRLLAKNMEIAGIDCDLVEVEDEPHVFVLVPRWLSPNVAISITRAKNFLLSRP